MKYKRFSITTDASGNATVNGDYINGQLYAVVVNKGTLAATTDITVSIVGSDFARTLLALTDVSANATYYPRAQASDTVGAAIAGEYVPMPAIGKPRVTVAQGGASATGTVDLIWLD